MGQLHDRMETDLLLGGYSPSTSRIYLCYARQFAKYHWRSPTELGEEEIRQFLLHLVVDRKVSRETSRQARAALQFLYRVTLHRPVEVEYLPVRRTLHPLPVILSGSEVQALLEAVEKPKYRAMLMTLYAGGLRNLEACRLRPEDIDSKRMLIHVRAGKGGRDRYTLLSTRLLAYLRDYWRTERPKDWLFPGRSVPGHTCTDTVRGVFRAAREAAGISKKVTPHVLRHCFATHLLESGVDITVIQALLGHASPRVTALYAHVSLEHLARTPSPLDLLGTPQAACLG